MPGQIADGLLRHGRMRFMSVLKLDLAPINGGGKIPEQVSYPPKMAPLP
jgi:hypothetical protein